MRLQIEELRTMSVDRCLLPVDLKKILTLNK